MPHVLQSLSTILMDVKERIRRGDLSVLSRKSDEAWRDHGHHHRSSTPRRIALTTQRASICVHSVAYLGLADNSRGALLSCLRGLSPPVVRSRNRLSAPYATLLSCLSTHRSRAVGRSCSWCMRYRTWGCGQGGTR